MLACKIFLKTCFTRSKSCLTICMPVSVRQSPDLDLVHNTQHIMGVKDWQILCGRNDACFCSLDDAIIDTGGCRMLKCCD